MSEQDTASTGRETAPETAQETESSSSTAKTKTKTKAKTKARPGKKSMLTEEFWANLRELYESGNYSQRDLANHAKNYHGVILTQPRIARRAGQEGWIKGHRIDEIREKARDDVRNEVAEGYRKMLQTHSQQAKLLQSEVTRHISKAHEIRKVDDTYVLPAALLRQLTSCMREAQEMEARAIGFDYKEGRPFKSPDEEVDAQIESMRIDVMTPEEEAKIRDTAEREVQGLIDQDDGVE